jgi:hypothetical protein
LKQSTAQWKIVVGHHTIRTAGKHGDTEELVQLLLPMLKVYIHSSIGTCLVLVGYYQLNTA